ncbi:hypothetical protein ONZ51_g4798 [Trametes cubensis]|uniref:Ras-domain-containing protein n=1 Tax=Trametes cubensis TaxID=1111947 RepID=A0AAD7TV55_9APHY|nr:hypothetical protein ONZ51_g4798 [Trametes cubensis]
MMAEYPRLDPYRKARYDQGVDAKIVIMGNTGVGKTSLLHRYTQGKFDPKNTTSTTGAFFVTKKVTVGGTKVRLQLWDTAGQERFRSMAPMYYRGANAALLLYDITNASSFEDVRGWLEGHFGLGSPLIAHLVPPLHDRPTPPPPPPPPSTFSYIRPRFTSFTSIRSVPALTSPKTFSPPPEVESFNDPRSSGMKRSNTQAYTRPRAKSGDLLLPRSNSTTANTRPTPSRFGYRPPGWNDIGDGSSNSLPEDDEGDTGEDQEWGLRKGMELFEVSAKDDFGEYLVDIASHCAYVRSGIQNLFDSLIDAIIEKKDKIEQENEIKRRDSVLLSSSATPVWAAQADQEEAREKARAATGTSWSCCQT